MKVLALLPAAILLSACGATKYCLQEQDYQKAAVVPDLKPAQGLVLPASAGALRMPPEPANPTPFGVEAKDGKGSCLDQPPRLAPVKPKPASVTAPPPGT
jgi:hypothetical protein